MVRKILVSLCLALSMLAMFVMPVEAAELAPYDVKVDAVNQLTYIYKLNEDSEYVLFDVWATSTGKSGTPTVTGTYTLKPLSYFKNSGEWYYFQARGVWVNYVTQIKGNYLFHSPGISVRTYSRVPTNALNAILSQDSMGCVRVYPRQAAFMWYNMGGCKVTIYKGEVTENTEAHRARLKEEKILTPASYPLPVITENTVYWYTYHGDTVEVILKATGLTFEVLVELNPEYDFESEIAVGQVLRIKNVD